MKTFESREEELQDKINSIKLLIDHFKNYNDIGTQMLINTIGVILDE